MTVSYVNFSLSISSFTKLIPLLINKHFILISSLSNVSLGDVSGTDEAPMSLSLCLFSPI